MESFGECLRNLLDKKKVASGELAKEINVDPAQISRWMHDTRTPSLGSTYVERIAEELSLSPAERKRLSDAQVETLKRPPAGRRRTGGMLDAAAMPKRGGGGQSAPGERTATKPQWPTAGTTGYPEAGLPVLEALQNLGEPLQGDDTITITFQATAAPESPDPTMWKPYREALHRALRQGWRLRELWRLNDDPARSATFAAHMLDMASLGSRYDPYFFTRYGTLDVPYELVIIPGQAAFQIVATTSIRSVDTIAIMATGEAMRPLREHAELLARQTAPVFARYPIARRAAFAEVLAEAEAMPGGRMMVKHGLTVYTEPEAWSHPDSHWARRMARMGTDANAMIATRKRRLEAFRQNVRLFPYRDICPESAIRELVEQGAYTRDDAPEGYDAAGEDVRAEHLRSAIEVLETFDKYSLALINDHEAARIGIRPDTWWAVVGATRAMLDVRMPDGHGGFTDIDLDITEPMIAAGFARHFENIWERIGSLHRDKAHVIRRLRQQLAQLDAR